MPRIEAPTLAEHQALRRRALVDSATLILAEQGPQAVTPAAVANRAGLARSSTYQYFPSTEALLRTAVETYFTRATQRVSEALDPGAEPLERIQTYLDLSLDAAVDGHHAMAGLMEMDLPHECRARVRELHTEMTSGLRTALIDAGVPDPDLRVSLVMGLIQAGARQVNQGADPAMVRAAVLDFVSAGLALGAA